MKPKKQTLLWRIEHDSFPAASYLFGTMHVRDRRAFENAVFALGKIEETAAFAAEFHLADVSGYDSSSMLLPDGKTLEDYIPPRKFEKLRKIFLKTARLDIRYFSRSVPFVMINLLGAQMLESGMQQSLDEYLWHHAEKKGKAMFGIETLAEQLAVLEKIPLPVQVKMLLDAGKNIGSYRRQLLHMVALYEQADLVRLFKTVKKSSKGLRKPLLYRRNEIMAERISTLASSQSLFAAIGAGHLSGKKGVIKLLKDKGLKVSPVKVSE